MMKTNTDPFFCRLRRHHRLVQRRLGKMRLHGFAVALHQVRLSGAPLPVYRYCALIRNRVGMRTVIRTQKPGTNNTNNKNKRLLLILGQAPGLGLEFITQLTRFEVEKVLGFGICVRYS